MVRLLPALLAALLIAAPLAQAKTLRWSSQGDYITADPHAQNELLTNSINGHVYEGLVTRGKQLEIIPQLAVSWKQTSPTVWVFNLRKGVKWHDGSDFTADDVVFSIRRAQGETSNFRVYGNAVGTPRKIDSHTVEFTTPVPNPVMLEMMANSLFIMNKAWCEKNRVEKAQDFKNREESFASRNAMGTGPFTLVSREPDVKSVFKRNPNWWGLKENLFEGNVTDIVYSPVKAEGTRMAALLSGNLDFVLDPPVQDVEKLKQNKAVRVYDGRENRIIFLGMDQARDELLYSNVKGKNPFKDRRVREAMYRLIDVDAINKAVMRGLSVPTAINLPNPTRAGIPREMDKRYPHDVAAARKLLADAGYPNGFEVTLDCPNNRYINDEKLCQAVAAMLAQIDVKVKLNAMPRTTYFSKIQKHDTSFYMLGWGVPTFDSLYALQSLMRTVGQGGDGNYNLGKYSNPKVDAAIDAMKTEMDLAKRRGLAKEALSIHMNDVGHIPLHHQVIPWAMRSNVTAVHRADNRMHAKWVTIN